MAGHHKQQTNKKKYRDNINKEEREKETTRKKERGDFSFFLSRLIFIRYRKGLFRYFKENFF